MHAMRVVGSNCGEDCIQSTSVLAKYLIARAFRPSSPSLILAKPLISLSFTAPLLGLFYFQGIFAFCPQKATGGTPYGRRGLGLGPIPAKNFPKTDIPAPENP
jgi:hypothetical protein